ncbi:MAG: helix-turn-helix transcriptional regulator [Lawsonibacter sp.]|nr:helix-turn-helix transcriptional regulator [Lawsonibacter sp.]
MTLGQRIQELRKKQGLSQEALGEKLGVSRQAISRWEMDGAVPEVDKLIALSQLFGVSLNDLLQVEQPEEKIPDGTARSPNKDRKLIRLLVALCVVLTLISAASLGCTMYFRHQVMNVLDPPQAPAKPVTAVEYAIQRNSGIQRTFDFAARLTLEEEKILKGWDVTLEVHTAQWDSEGKTEYVRREAEIRFKDGTAQVCLENMPFLFRENVGVYLCYSNEKKQLRGEQALLAMIPQGATAGEWTVRRNAAEYGFIPVENPELLEPQ